MASLVDCKWGDWEAWESCSESCGTGMKQRSRYFTQMAMHDGNNCTGQSTESQMCYNGPCHGSLFFIFFVSHSLFYVLFCSLMKNLSFQSTAPGVHGTHG